MDVTSLYMNIPHDDGIAACRKIWEQRTDQEPLTECLVEMVVVSRKNILVFDTSCVNFIDGWILLACSKYSSSSLSPCNRSRTSDRMFSGDAYTSSKKQQFYF
jgi:hypothetical protein